MTPQEFKQIRSELGLTQVKIAEALGVTWRTVARYESGERPITRTIAILLGFIVLHAGRSK